MAAVAASPSAKAGEENIEPYAPAGVFISYATEDHDIADAFYQSLQKSGETFHDRIKIFMDQKSIAPGEDIQTEITKSLDKSDFLIVIYTGVYKKTHGYTGWEVGYFRRLRQEDIVKTGKTSRKAVALYFNERPPVMEGVLGIPISVDPANLARSRQEYVAASVKSPDEPDVLATLFLEIAKRAEDRFPPQLLEDQDALERMHIRRREMLTREIIPDFRGKMYDASSTRITKQSIEQKLIEFELPSMAAEQGVISIPDQTKLTQHSGSFAIFGYSPPNDTVTWEQFQREMKSRDLVSGASVLLAIEQALLSAVSPALNLDNDQIVKSLVGAQVYRIIITQQIDYYDGRKKVHLYFIEKINSAVLGNRDSALILSFINVAAKYRSVFLESDSSLSAAAFYLEHDPKMVKTMTKRLMRELILIEEEAHNSGLDEASAITKYFGAGERLQVAKKLQIQWYEVRQKLQVSAEQILKTSVESADWQKAIDDWLATLSAFRKASGEINSTVTMQALDNLKQVFSQKLD